MFMNVCESSGTLSVILLVKHIITIFKILIPVILIIISAYDLLHTVVDLRNKVYQKIIKRLIALVCVFFIPTILSLFFDVVGTSNFLSSSCWTNANTSTIAIIKHQEEIEAEAEEAARQNEHKKAEEEREKVAEAREKARLENEKRNEEARKKLEEQQQQTKQTSLNGHNINLAAGNHRVYFLDVVRYRKGRSVQGSDSMVLESNGHYALIDAGVSANQARVLRYLKDIGATTLDFAVITHAHSDHYGGYNYLINHGIKVKRLYVKKKSYGAIKNIMNNSKSKGTEVRDILTKNYRGETLGDMRINFYNLEKQDNGTVENMNSIVTLVTILNKKFYLSADIGGDLNYTRGTAGYKLEAKVAKQVGKVDVYKASHHSLDSNNPADAIKVLNPSYGVVTATKEKGLTSKARKRMINNSAITSNTLYYTGRGTVIFTIQNNGNFVIQQLPQD